MSSAEARLTAVAGGEQIAAEQRDPLERDFSIVLGGPLYQAWLRLGLARPPLNLVRRRAFLLVALTWLPLLILTLLAGNAFGGVQVPFLYDLDTHARFLLALPLLVWAELLVHDRLRAAVRQFLERGIVTPEERVRFDQLMASIWRLRNSVVAEVVLLVLAFTGGYWLWKEQIALQVATWYGATDEGTLQLTTAGYFYAFVSLPVARFLLGRWYFRIMIWYVFLFRLTRLNLRLNPLHPDRAGGLGFIGNTPMAMAPILLAHTVLLSGVIGNNIWHEGQTLPDFKLEIVAIVAGLLVLALAPLTFFFFHLEQAKRRGGREYGLLATNYVAAFREKWLANEVRGEAMLGNTDIQSLADLSGGYDPIREMRLLPFGRNQVLHLAIIICLPLLPLTLTMIPLDQIVDRLIKVVL